MSVSRKDISEETRGGIYSCNDELDQLFASSENRIVVYGRAAAGKTNFVLNVMKCTKEQWVNQCKDSWSMVFINSESMDYTARLVQLGLTDDRIYVIDVLDQLSLISALMEALGAVKTSKCALVIVDSVNSLYRFEASFNPLASEVFVQILELLELASKNVHVIVTAQVHQEEETIELVGKAELGYWASIIIRIDKCNRHRCLVVEKPENKVMRQLFVIDRTGIKWLKHFK